MIEDLKPYSETRDSGLPWLGDIPAHWEIKRNGSLFQQRNAVGEPDWPILEVSLRTGVRIREFGSNKRKQVMSDKAKYKCATKGDFVYNMMRMWQGAAGIAPVDGLVSPAYVVAKPLPHTNPAYFASLFRTDDYLAEIDAFSRGIVKDRNRLYWDQFKQIPTPCPPPEEQAAIARFLAWATNRLDRAIGAKRRIIALLNEQKQAIINRAVTRGLDPSVPLKDSGIPWLGEIPEHWEVRKIRAVASRVTKGTTPTTLGKQFVASGIRFVKVESISANRNILEWKCAFIDDATDRLLSRSKLRANDVVVSIAGAIGRPAIISPSLLPANTNQAVGIISPLNHLCRSEWLTYVLASQMCLRSLSESSVQSAQANLSLTSLGRAAIGLPHVHEQDMIVARLSIVVSSVANTISRLEREITLLREYRTRLIADVVTGKLDVREAAKGLPEEVLQVQPDVAAGYAADEAEDDAESDLIDTAED